MSKSLPLRGRDGEFALIAGLLAAGERQARVLVRITTVILVFAVAATAVIIALMIAT